MRWYIFTGSTLIILGILLLVGYYLGRHREDYPARHRKVIPPKKTTKQEFNDFMNTLTEGSPSIGS